ncbi:exopolyphosphatase [Winkia sp. UMB6473-AN360BR]|uniref:Ppx/GppA phosphatase family protein n=2 Tax=Bacillati TaxID=1783272 RepID=UPI000C717CA0|nr:MULTISPECIES: exopolyphosphatase [Winkia]PLB79791.1 exopolyphosphatase [Actinomyces sp. UMB0138]MDK7185236.1 exopolyphosphatase [Winkia sp. UMB1295B]MDK7904956.1 exopolyphosphatase [Winkia sp. UMB0889B]MDK8816385.1 exopolyphosphatase [Winkia sp. UMB6473-AN360BR]NJJ15679.1 exopolyphosphatase [Winkia neuii]
MRKVAGIDCGTNSIRLILAEGEDGEIFRSTKTMKVIRLGQNLDATGQISEAALQRAFAATREYAQKIADFGAEKVRFVATSASRDAKNAEVFAGGIKQILGQAPEVIPGSLEASLSFQGALSGNVPPLPALIVDIGGGSTEFILGDEQEQKCLSTPMGSVRFTERYFPGEDGIDLSSPANARASEQARKLIAQADAAVSLKNTKTLVGVAGTSNTVMAMALGLSYDDQQALDSAVLSCEEMIAACEKMATMTVAERARLPYMPSGREDVIGAGALIWKEIVAAVADASGISQVRCSSRDILDGIALSLL